MKGDTNKSDADVDVAQKLATGIRSQSRRGPKVTSGTVINNILSDAQRGFVH